MDSTISSVTKKKNCRPTIDLESVKENIIQLRQNKHTATQMAEILQKDFNLTANSRTIERRLREWEISNTRTIYDTPELRARIKVLFLEMCLDDEEMIQVLQAEEHQMSRKTVKNLRLKMGLLRRTNLAEQYEKANRLVSDIVPQEPVRSTSSEFSDPSDLFTQELYTNTSRKRRRIAPSDSDEIEDALPYTTSIVSRVKSSRNMSASEKPPMIQQTVINNGKLVDALSSFATLDVAPWLIASLSAMAIQRPTAIQKGCIPQILAGKDVIGGSRTGSGKTVAFSVPILQMWAEDPMATYAVVLTPTRELALQIFEQFKAISAPQALKPILITGGTDMRTQALALSQRPHVVIATPGRLADHITTSGRDTILGLRHTRVVVLDEADRLLASGPGSMLPDVETCLAALPPSHQRQTCLFTATLTPEVMALKALPRPKDRPPIYVCEVDVSAPAIPPALHQAYLQVPLTYREAYLHILLLTPRNAAKKSIMVFCNRTKTANLLERLLRGLDHRVTSLHSILPQYERTSNLARFRASAAKVLVATDVASRGLDIPDVELVINYDVPRNPDDYIHRVGRTARAGRKGEAITMVGQRDVGLLLEIEARVGRKMVEFEEEGVNIETRVVRDALKEVGEKKREVVIGIEEGRDIKGNRTRGKIRRLE